MFGFQYLICFLKQTLLGGINMVDYDPWSGDFTGTVVRDNLILGGFATDANDIDIYSCDASGVAGCFEEGGAGGTTKTPEVFVFKAPAGVHYLVIEQYSVGEDANVIVTIKKLN